ncbi:MAG: tetratricopeptide repeat protein [Bdellovibrio sp.]
MKQLRLIAATVLISVPTMMWVPSSEAANKSSRDVKQEALLAELTGVNPAKKTDMELYSEMMEAYEQGREIVLKNRLQTLLQRYPQSSYADNALFLAGRMAVDRSQYAEAIRYFARIEKDYPQSNRLVAAKFAKAMTYKKMNLPEFAKKVLSEVRGRYPGSPESFRADAELKIYK